MARFTYRIDRYFSDTEDWGIENDDARGTENYDGTAKEYAKEIAQNRYADLLSLDQTGEWRILVWDGDTESDEDDIDALHLFTVTEEDLKPRGGRPKIGNIVSVAMGDTLPKVDAYAQENDIKRAEAIRTLVTVGLAPTENLVWSVVRGESPDANAVEPGVAGIDIPEAISAWAASHGLNEADPDVYLLVTPEDEAGEVQGEIAYTTLTASRADADLVREALLIEQAQTCTADEKTG
ncbi:hypothetical protein [Nocardiopsis alba]|uniref:hypothetical protein n=1 Tax=Nocardiopsis alba TaxID=53437 RepID=UPI0033AC8AC4